MKTILTISADFKEHIAKFVSIRDEEFQHAMSFFTPKKLGRGEFLIQAGEAVRYTHWTKVGLLISTYTNADGKEHIIQFANEGCWITDQNAFYNQTKATFHIRALEDCELLAISFDSREKLCDESRTMEQFFRRKANDSFAKQQSRLLAYLTSDAEGRFDLFNREYPSLRKRISKKDLAAYLGVSRETLSRFNRKMDPKK